jgi:hypothetical protein
MAWDARPRHVQQWSGITGGHDMATVMDCGAGSPVGTGRPGTVRPTPFPLTLYDLITAIQDVVGPEDDGLVVATVRHLLRSVRLTGHGIGTRRCPPAAGAGVVAHGAGWGKASERRGTPVALLPASRWRRSAGAAGKTDDPLPERR